MPAQTQSQTQTERLEIAAASRIGPALLALLFGGFLIFGVGFANSATIHNAAHDGRHALAFPCH